MADQGRHKGRGRGKNPDERRHQTRPTGPHSSSQPTPSAWGRRPGTVTSQPGPSFQAPYARPPAPQQSMEQPMDRGDRAPGYSRQAQPEKIEVESIEGGSGDVGALGRGAMRGRRVIMSETLQTKPKNLVTKQGKTGKAMVLKSNYFKLLTTTDWCLYQYRVDFSPEEDRTVVRKGLLRLHKETLGAYIFDGTVLYSSYRLQDKMELWSVRQSDDTKIRITIRFVGDMTQGDHHYIQFFNIIMRKCLDLLKLQLVGRDYYDALSKVEVHEFRLELWPGYLTSIRQHEKNILMCAEITHKVMRQQTLLDILNDCYQQNNRAYKDIYNKEVIGLVVLTDYNNNTYRITDVDYSANPSSTFQLRNGESISYRDYYKNKYQIKITNSSQPMLVTKVKPKDRRAGQAEFVYLVPELCRATGLTDGMREHFQLMKALSEHTRVNPKSRMDKLMMFNRRLRSEQGIVKELKEWNLKLDETLVDVPGRVLAPENIVLGGRTVSAGPFADWTREMFNKALFNVTKLSSWVFVCTNYVKNDAHNFIRELKDSARGMGCRIDDPRFYDIRDDRSGTYADALEQIMSKCNPELIFCVVSNNRSDRYTTIKKKCLIDRPVPSQVFLQKNLRNPRGLKSIATKVAIQLTCKLGGAPWSVELPNINLMVIGFDVCHDADNKSRDFGALVASVDKGLTRYFSAVSSHGAGEELSNDLATNVAKALSNYRQINKSYPSHILLYRDGVGEGQIPTVFEHEVGNLTKKLHEIYGDASLVKMAFIIVTKRINTRFFLNQNNPPPGTIVDDVVTNPMKYDFFIVSQNVRQGSVSPTAYSVIADTTGWSADQMQRITYKLTHMYYNWSGTVRVPAPCQYAHKLAFLVSQFLHRSPSTQMENLLYYL